MGRVFVFRTRPAVWRSASRPNLLWGTRTAAEDCFVPPRPPCIAGLRTAGSGFRASGNTVDEVLVEAIAAANGSDVDLAGSVR